MKVLEKDKRNTINRDEPLCIIVIGASGDLAIRKIFPALFSLYCQELLPKEIHIVGYARTEMSNEAFQELVNTKLTCRYVPGERCDQLMAEFLQRCTYISGQYDNPESFNQLYEKLQTLDSTGKENRIFYMSIPPFLFLDVAHALADAGLVHRSDTEGWSRVVIEKPFGSDRESSDELTSSMGKVFTEEQTFRIDHYLGKEVIQNLMVLRFANLIFDPLWNRTHIENVHISWMENLGLEGRAGYFESYGIIRDVMQNHLLQMVALVAMEQPLSLHSQHVRDEKVKALRSISSLRLNDLVVGQYSAGAFKGRQHFGYLQEKGVRLDSITPTYACAVLHIRNRRWDGVPFMIQAGKGLHDSKTEIRIQFRDVPANIFSTASNALSNNELVIRVQPDAGMSLRIVNKAPGLGINLVESNLDLRYEAAFNAVIPDAYESLLLDVLEGDKSLFIRSDELEAAWDVFTPVLHQLEKECIKPEQYEFGSAGPLAAKALASRFNVKWDEIHHDTV